MYTKLLALLGERGAGIDQVSLLRAFKIGKAVPDQNPVISLG